MKCRLPSQRISLVSLPASIFSRSLKAWKLVMTILAWPSCSSWSAGDDVAQAVIVLGSLGSSTRSRSRIVMPGVTIRNVSENRAVLRVGQLVQRLPGDQHGHDDGLAGAGRHLEGDAAEPGLDVSLASRTSFSIQVSPNFLATSVSR